eukprot:NODE_361_length_10144_cov_0.288402.p4 type:complete len:154 gc:universal NODE_361_length_10144_cov_0.288402:7353-7814(+)
MGFTKFLVTYLAASNPISITLCMSVGPNLTITESVSPYITKESCSYPFFLLYLDSTKHLVCSIMSLPNAVTLADTSKQGKLPMVAPVNPYTLLALNFRASCLPFKTAFLNSFVSFFKSDLACFLAPNKSANIRGSKPSQISFLTKQSPVGERV